MRAHYQSQEDDDDDAEELGEDIPPIEEGGVGAHGPEAERRVVRATIQEHKAVEDADDEYAFPPAYANHSDLFTQHIALNRDRTAYRVTCRLERVKPNKQSIQELYDYVAWLRELPLPFQVKLAAEDTKFLWYIPFLSRLMKEFLKSGRSDCKQVRISFKDFLGIGKSLARAQAKAAATKPGCQVILEPMR